MEEFKRDACIRGAEEMPRESPGAIARDGKLPVKDLFVSGSPFAGFGLD